MSLINDALNRARAEAARRQAAERGEIAAPEPPPESTVQHRIPAWFWALGALLLVTGVLLLRRVPADPDPRSDRDTAAGLTAVAPAGSATAEPAIEAVPQALARSITPLQAARPEPSNPLLTDGPSPTSAGASAPPEAASVSDSVATGSVDATPGVAIDSGAEAAGDGQVATVWPGDPSGEEVWYYVGKIALPGGGEIELDGIVWSASSPSAMLNGSLLQVGSEVLGLRVAEIQQRTVILTGHGRRLALQLGPAQ